MANVNPTIRRWSWFAIWSAWRAVRAGVPLVEFLAFRSAKYQASLIGRDCLAPFYVDLTDPRNLRSTDHALQKFITEPAKVASASPPDGRIALLRPLEPHPSEYIVCRDDLVEVEERLEEADQRVRGVEAERDELERELGGGVKIGTFTTRLIDRLWARRFRVAVVSLSILIAFHLRVTVPVLGFVTTEAVQLLYLMLDLVGVRIDVGDPWMDSRVALLSGIALAVVAGVGIVILADWVFELLVVAYAGWRPRMQAYMRLLLAGSLAAFTGTAIWYLADLRWGFISNTVAQSGASKAWALLFVSYLLPLTAGYLIHHGREAWKAAQARRAQLLSDRAPGDAVAIDSVRLREALRLTLRRLERETGLKRRFEERRGALLERLKVAEQEILVTIDRHMALIRRIEQLLELDAYVFSRRAHRKGLAGLLSLPSEVSPLGSPPHEPFAIPSNGPTPPAGPFTPDVSSSVDQPPS